jgi:glycosyltransferase involved in cell wall biosynthesis
VLAITVAMITLNEEAAVAKVIRDIQRAVSNLDAEILIVDSSRDKTPEIAASLGARVVRQLPPQGYGRAMMRALTEAQGTVVITLDCDDTYPADRISELAAAVLSGAADLVNASRLRSRPEFMPFANYLANRFFALLSRIVLGVKTSDVHSGMRAYRRTILQHVTFDAAGPALPVELLLKPALLGYRISEVFIPYRERIGVTTLRRWASTLWTLKRIFRLLPLRFQSQCREQTLGEAG